MSPRRPNLVYVFADEWRAQALGCAGDPNLAGHTDTIDAFARESLRLPHAVAGYPICCPFRASLLSGQYPLTHGVIINDACLDPEVDSIARAFGRGGYRTGYIGKWHVHGSPGGQHERRTAPVPREHQLGFDDWWGFECTHNYNKSRYYHDDDPQERQWEGYDAFAQSRCAADYIQARAGDDQPFLLMLSWGPPHGPLHTAPDEYRRRFRAEDLVLRPNVPAHREADAREHLSGYYAHIAALDDCFRMVLDAIDEAGIANETYVVFTSDHGEMAGCQDLTFKHTPFDESVNVPFYIRGPGLAAGAGIDVPIDAPDLMPTLLGLAGLPAPASVEGRDWAPELRGQRALVGDEAALLIAPVAFGELTARGIPPYRGLRSARHTYVRTRVGPWLLFDHVADPHQLRNLVDRPEHAALQARLDAQLDAMLAARGDEFLAGEAYVERFGLGHYRILGDELRDQWRYPWDQLEATLHGRVVTPS